MMFADRQDVGRPGDSHFHCGRWMLPGVVVDLIPYTCRAGKTPRPSQSGHGSRVGLLLPKPVRRAFHYVAHPDRPARTVRQRPLGSPAEAARSPSVRPDRSGHGCRDDQLARSVTCLPRCPARTRTWTTADRLTLVAPLSSLRTHHMWPVRGLPHLRGASSSPKPGSKRWF
jgi:hypothetical protein